MKPHISTIIMLAAVSASLLSGCAASQKLFYSDVSKIKNTQLCRTGYDAAQRDGPQSQYVKDIIAEAHRRGLNDEQCRSLVTTEDAVIIGALVGATVVGVGIACSKGCATPSGGGAYRPSYAGITDVDCRGGTGNGPRYTANFGPFPIDPYDDPFNLDGDGDGIACEVGEGGVGT